jgi:hypothetical protein
MRGVVYAAVFRGWGKGVGFPRGSGTRSEPSTEHSHLQDRNIRPHQRAHVPEKQGSQRPVDVSQDPRLLEGRGRASPAEREVAPHLPAAMRAATLTLAEFKGIAAIV